MPVPERKGPPPAGGMDTVRWHALAAARLRVPPVWQGVLFPAGSLTARLRARCGAGFTVQVLAETPRRLRRREAAAMRLPVGAPVRWREVYLCCDGQPVVYACSLLPRAALRGPWCDLTHLGSRPLGELLFTRRGVRRGPLDIGCIRPGAPLHRAMSRGLAVPPGALWGRRSMFRLPDAPVVVCEFFLPLALDILHA